MSDTKKYCLCSMLSPERTHELEGRMRRVIAGACGGLEGLGLGPKSDAADLFQVIEDLSRKEHPGVLTREFADMCQEMGVVCEFLR